MPTPLELLLRPLSFAFFGMYAVLMLWEAIAPARVLPRIARWRTRGLLAAVFYFLLSSYLPMLWTQFLLPLQLFDLSHLAWPVGGLVDAPAWSPMARREASMASGAICTPSVRI